MTPPSFSHGAKTVIGVLATNLGTPDSCKAKDVRRYLKQFLWDPRVVEISRIPWWFVLNGIILNTRPRRSAKAYQKIWTETGSPLLNITKAQVASLQSAFKSEDIEVEIAMRYGNPSIESGLSALKKKGADRILILPLYPQYSATTTASTFDAVAEALKKWRRIPEIRFIHHYHDHPRYINALAGKIKSHWAEHGQADHLLMSFHGIPQDYFESGDPYHCECHKTGRLLADELGLSPQQWTLSFQSRLGPKKWLQPYTDHILEALPSKGITSIQVVCPGFSADCLETLEEIAIENRETFTEAGGKRYEYIPCLNDDPAHIQLLTTLINEHTQSWGSTSSDIERDNTRKRAISMGAPD